MLSPPSPAFRRSSGSDPFSPPRQRYYANPGSEIKWPPEVLDYNEKFTKLLSNIKKRHDPVVTTVARGVLEYKREKSTPNIDKSIQTFLDRFYMSRIGIRVLIGQHIALNRLEPHPDYVGIICTKTNIYDICREAIDNALFICEEHYGLFGGPKVQLFCPKDLNFMYIPSHLVSRSLLALRAPTCSDVVARRITCSSRSLKTRCERLSRRTAWKQMNIHL